MGSGATSVEALVRCHLADKMSLLSQPLLVAFLPACLGCSKPFPRARVLTRRDRTHYSFFWIYSHTELRAETSAQLTFGARHC